MSPAVFENAISANEWRQSLALNRAVIGIGFSHDFKTLYFNTWICGKHNSSQRSKYI